MPAIPDPAAESSLSTALRGADHVYVMEKGQIRLTAELERLRASPELLQRYLGVDRLRTA